MCLQLIMCTMANNNSMHHRRRRWQAATATATAATTRQWHYTQNSEVKHMCWCICVSWLVWCCIAQSENTHTNARTQTISTIREKISWALHESDGNMRRTILLLILLPLFSFFPLVRFCCCRCCLLCVCLCRLHRYILEKYAGHTNTLRKSNHKHFHSKCFRQLPSSFSSSLSSPSIAALPSAFMVLGLRHRTIFHFLKSKRELCIHTQKKNHSRKITETNTKRNNNSISSSRSGNNKRYMAQPPSNIVIPHPKYIRYRFLARSLLFSRLLLMWEYGYI